jgi:hypothetical protein
LAKVAQEMSHFLATMSHRQKTMATIGGPALMLRGHHRKASLAICIADDERFTALTQGMNQKMCAIMHTTERDFANPEERVMFANEFLALLRLGKQQVIAALLQGGRTKTTP